MTGENKQQRHKQRLRAQFLSDRKAYAAGTQPLLADAPKAQLDTSLLAHLRSVVAGKNIAAYSPLPSEPGGKDFVSKLHDCAASVLLPMAHDSGEMTWSYFDPQQPLVPGALGILEPVGQTFDSSILSTCNIVVMPALAVDSRGYRLGKGAGYYDRALVHTHAVLLAAVYPWEYVKDLPYEHHDKPVDGIVTGESVTWISQ